MKAKLLLRQPVLPKAFGEAASSWPPYEYDRRFVWAPTGTDVVGPETWRNVKAGNCEPADDECRAACEARGIDITPGAIARRLRKYKKLERGQFTGNTKFDAK